MGFLKLTEQDISGKTVLIRADMNVPLKNGTITDDTRIRASIASIQYCLQHGAAVIVMTHLGRPTEGVPKPEDDIAPIAQKLSELLAMPVTVLSNWQVEKPVVPMGSVAMLPNVRLNQGEKKNSAELGAAYAALCDVYVNDAFGTAHRAEASTEAVARAAPVACAGLLMSAELSSLAQAMENPQQPLVAIVGGSKVSTKLMVLEQLADKVDQLIVGGGIANTFLLAKGLNVGQSLVEKDLVIAAQNIISKIEQKGGYVPLPSDVVVAKEFSADAVATIKAIEDIDDDDMILDIGPQSIRALKDILMKAGTIVWNGPVGVFELEAFAQGTRGLSESIAQSDAFSIAGGGDTLAAIAQFGVTEQISYISTGGGAFLEFLEGKSLPAVVALQVE